jgi:two-component system, OmpR family, phosphate regulon sensor histidine kinase PhoR
VELVVHAGAPAPIVGDASRLGQVLDNLISNALKFTPSGGRVDVSVAAAADGVVLEVRDTGAGIPAAEQERLFERFYRTAGAQAGAVPGTGLGLSIVRAIVEAHHGRVALESAEGKGSAFRVWLPEGDGAHDAAADLNATGRES